MASRRLTIRGYRRILAQIIADLYHPFLVIQPGGMIIRCLTMTMTMIQSFDHSRSNPGSCRPLRMRRPRSDIMPRVRVKTALNPSIEFRQAQRT
jgi:hypothetical protein